MVPCGCSGKHELFNRSKARNTAQVSQNSTEEREHFRFVDLPPEMRDLVYKAALIPTGFISLRSCAHHIPTSVCPRLATRILEISKTTKKEVDALLLENTIIVNACLESGSRPAIHRSQLPAHILPRVESLVIVVDFTRMLNTLNVARTVDWRVAQGLTGLKKLRICGIAIVDQENRLSDYLAQYLEIIIERIPVHCRIYFGEQDGGPAVEAHMQDMVQKISDADQTFTELKNAYSMDASRLEKAWKGIAQLVKQGCRSGCKEDFRFEDRRAGGELERAWLQQRRVKHQLMEGDDNIDDDDMN